MPDTASLERDRNRQFARQIVERLRHCGYEAYWAGGCVRDALLGRVPKDYDVASNARPEEVREVFGQRHTLPIGQAFGVITVRGERGIAPVEVATFRRDVGYSDGRHPDSVVFSCAEEDAQRRDFTINGMFYDPIADAVVDYVGGQQDLAAGVVRAIRDPRERFHEDKLRMLRAIRFAATFGFALEANTLAAIRELAREIVIVSAERIAAEMRRILPHSTRRRGVELLSAARLLPVLIPEWSAHDPEAASIGPPPESLATVATRSANLSSPWNRTLELLERLHNPAFPAVLAALIHTVIAEDECDEVATRAETICRRWKLSLDEIHRTTWLLQHARQVIAGPERAWPRLQPLLVASGAGELVDYSEALAQAERLPTDGIAFCREKMSLPAAELNPAPLIDGADLKRFGLSPGPRFRVLLDDVRDRQLLGELKTPVEAIDYVRRQIGGDVPK